MQFYAAILRAFSILALTASTLGNHADVNCPPIKDHETNSLHDMLVDGFSECFRKVGNIDLQTLTSNAESSNETRMAIMQYCHNEDLIMECLSARSSGCNETQDNDSKFVEDILKTSFFYSCVANGRHLEYIITAVYDETNSTDQNAFTDCFAAANSTGVEGNAQDASTRLLGFYREVKAFKQCLVDRLRGFNIAVFGAELMLNGILRSMKCPHPQDATTTLCETLDTSTIDKVCPFVRGEEGDQPSLKFMVNLVAECLIVNVNQLDFDILGSFIKIEDFRSFFNIYCQNQPHILNCLSDISSNSKVCQNETNHNFFELFKYLVKHSLETGCKESGANLATIYNGILNRAEPAMDNTTVQQCKHEAEKFYKSVSKADDTMSTWTVLLYRGADILKQCISDRSFETGTFKTVFTTFTNEILRAARCLADDGTVVPCETLVKN